MAKTKVIKVGHTSDGIELFKCQLYLDRQSNSHTLDENGQWRTWNGNSWEKCDECEIVESVHELNIQEL
jgi:hypothetical protein